MPHWDRVHLCNLPSGSIIQRVLSDEATRNGLSVERRVQDRCPVITLPDSWDAYLAGLDKKQRHEIRRKIRRAESQAETSWYTTDPYQGELAAEVSSFIDLHRLSSPEKDIFMHTAMRGFFHAIARATADRGWLHLSFIEMNGHRTAGMMSFDYTNSRYLYNSGFDGEQFGHLSPGIVLLSYSIREAIELGRCTFDFLRGDEEYKYRMGAEPVEVHELTISRN
jgi:CelD/BcsL family acetyltransferase involved in cellulose biosynthesis